jgi:hypothetical protein
MQCCNCNAYFKYSKGGCICTECYDEPFEEITCNNDIICSKCNESCTVDKKSYWTLSGYEYYIKIYNDSVLCDKCFENIPKRSVCRKCKNIFQSRNKLFKHLRDTDHFMVKKKCPPDCYQRKKDKIESDKMMNHINSQLKSGKTGCCISTTIYHQ